MLGNPALACGLVERAVLFIPLLGAAKDFEVVLLSREAEAIQMAPLCGAPPLFAVARALSRAVRGYEGDGTLSS